MRVLVTGGSGFIGTAIIKELLEKKNEVSALINRRSILKPDAADFDKCRIYRGDIRDAGSLTELEKADGFDAIIHSAGLAHQFGETNEQDFWDVNVLGTKNVAELAIRHSVKHFILLSSVAVYGKSAENARANNRKGLTEESECQPEGVYAVTKLESEKAARQICERRQTALTILRPATVIGENDRGNVYRLIRAIERRRFVWIGDGRNLKSLIYKGDVAEACLAVLNAPPRTGIYNLTADALTMKRIVEEIYKSLGRRPPRLKIPANFLNRIFRLNEKTLNVARLEKTSETIRKWLSDDVFAGDKFKRDFEFRIKTPIAEGIGREVESYLQSK